MHKKTLQVYCLDIKLTDIANTIVHNNIEKPSDIRISFTKEEDTGKRDLTRLQLKTDQVPWSTLSYS